MRLLAFPFYSLSSFFIDRESPKPILAYRTVPYHHRLVISPPLRHPRLYHPHPLIDRHTRSLTLPSSSIPTPGPWASTDDCPIPPPPAPRARRDRIRAPIRTYIRAARVLFCSVLVVLCCAVLCYYGTPYLPLPTYLTLRAGLTAWWTS